jgi:hypothetical protein
MKKQAFAMAAALTLVLAAGSVHAAGKVGGDNGQFHLGAQRLGDLPIDQISLNWTSARTDGVHAGARKLPGVYGEFATKIPPRRFP